MSYRTSLSILYPEFNARLALHLFVNAWDAIEQKI